MVKIVMSELLEEFSASALADALVVAGLPQAGIKSERIERLLSHGQKPTDELLRLFTAEALGSVGGRFGVPRGRKDEMIAGLLSFLEEGSSSTNEVCTPQLDMTQPKTQTYLPVTKQAVFDRLKELIIPRRKLASEATAMDAIGYHLGDVFEDVMPQYNIGGYLGLKIDIDVGNGKVGVEVKLADSLSASEIHRLIGQAIYYQKKRYGDDLIVSIAGLREDLNDPILKETCSFLGSLNITCVRIPAA